MTLAILLPQHSQSSSEASNIVIAYSPMGFCLLIALLIANNWDSKHPVDVSLVTIIRSHDDDDPSLFFTNRGRGSLKERCSSRWGLPAVRLPDLSLRGPPFSATCLIATIAYAIQLKCSIYSTNHFQVLLKCSCLQKFISFYFNFLINTIVCWTWTIFRRCKRRSTAIGVTLRILCKGNLLKKCLLSSVSLV